MKPAWRRWAREVGAVAVVLVLAVVGVAWVIGAIWPARPTYASWPAADGQLTVVSYNIRWGNHDWKNIAQIIRQQEADVALIQESSVDAERHLPSLLYDAYRDMEFRNASSRCGFAILSRYPIDNVRTILRDNGTYYLAMLADMKLGDRTVALANVHLRYKELLSDTESVRDREIRQIFDLLPADGPTIVAGDFNSNSHQVAPSYLKQLGFTDSFASVNPKPDKHGTWQWKKGPLRVTTRIDYIFHSPDFNTQASRVIQAGHSDHFPVVSRLSDAE